MKKHPRMAAIPVLTLSLLFSANVFAGQNANNVSASKTVDAELTLISEDVYFEAVSNPRLKAILTNGPVTSSDDGVYESPRVMLSPAYSAATSIAFQNNKSTPVTISLYKSDSADKNVNGTLIVSWTVAGYGYSERAQTIAAADINKYLYLRIAPTGSETSVSGTYNWIQK